MQLKSLWVDGYKNLIDTSVEFSGNEVPIAVIGNNGTGKSNLIEAILNIFISLYFGEVPDFRFSISYVAHGKYVVIDKLEDGEYCQIFVDGVRWSLRIFKERARFPELMPPFPAMIFGYYSGTCVRLERQFKRYSRTYAAKLRRQSRDLERSFVFSDINQAEYVLLGLLAHRHFELLREISISSLDFLAITIQPPESYDQDSDDPKFWGAEAAIREFLADIDNAAIDSAASIRPESGEMDSSTEWRRYFFNQQSLENAAAYLLKRGTTFFSMLEALSQKGILVKVEYTLKHVDEVTVFNFSELSEGEKQLISVIGGLWLLQKNECLVLLDEPDTHLNPAWTWRYVSLIKNALGVDERSSSSVLIATHNPVLISGLKKEQVLIAHNQNGRLRYVHPHRDPRGQGVANVLTSEFFGLPSSLDEHTQGLIDERLGLTYKQGKMAPDESARLKEINSQLDELGLSISFRDPDYAMFEKSKYGQDVAR